MRNSEEIKSAILQSLRDKNTDSRGAPPEFNPLNVIGNEYNRTVGPIVRLLGGLELRGPNEQYSESPVRKVQPAPQAKPVNFDEMLGRDQDVDQSNLIERIRTGSNMQPPKGSPAEEPPKNGISKIKGANDIDELNKYNRYHGITSPSASNMQPVPTPSSLPVQTPENPQDSFESYVGKAILGGLTTAAALAAAGAGAAGAGIAGAGAEAAAGIGAGARASVAGIEAAGEMLPEAQAAGANVPGGNAPRVKTLFRRPNTSIQNTVPQNTGIRNRNPYQRTDLNYLNEGERNALNNMENVNFERYSVKPSDSKNYLAFLPLAGAFAGGKAVTDLPKKEEAYSPNISPARPQPEQSNNIPNNVPQRNLSHDALAENRLNDVNELSKYNYYHGIDAPPENKMEPKKNAAYAPPGFKWEHVANPDYQKNPVSKLDYYLGALTEGLSGNRYEYSNKFKQQYHDPKYNQPYIWQLQSNRNQNPQTQPVEEQQQVPQTSPVNFQDAPVGNPNVEQPNSTPYVPAPTTSGDELTLYGAPPPIPGALQPINTLQMPMSNNNTGNLGGEQPRRQGNAQMGTVGEMPSPLQSGSVKQTTLYNLYGKPQNNNNTSTTNFVF